MTDKILLVMTGGTICSSENSEGKRSSDVKSAQYKILSVFRNSSSPYRNTEFECAMPLDILSENMTADSWNILLDFFRNIRSSDYKGIIILHGTDTLAYTSSMLSFILTDFDVPVILGSAQLPLSHEETNGNANFSAAVSLIMQGIEPNVYAVYRNSDGHMYLHYGASLRQCDNYSNDFYSENAVDITGGFYKGKRFETKNDFLKRVQPFGADILYIKPYTGINYSAYDLSRVKAVLHGTYHSESVCVVRPGGKGEYDETSVLYLLDRCRERNIPLFLSPCSGDAAAYESTGDAVASGALFIKNMTPEAAYAKLSVGISLGFSEKDLSDFLDRNINYENIYEKS